MSLVGVNNAKMNDVNLLTGKENTVIKRDILNFDSPSIFTKENNDNDIYKNHLPMRLLDLDDLENDDDYYKIPDTNIELKKQPFEEAPNKNPLKKLPPNTMEEPIYKNPILEDPEQPGKPILLDPMPVFPKQPGKPILQDPSIFPIVRFPKETPAPIQDPKSIFPIVRFFPKETPAPIQDKNFLATQTLEDVEAA